MTTTTSDPTVTDLEDRLAIIELIGSLSLAIDAKDWDAMGQLFTDTVYHDRTSLTGGEPYTAPVAQFVEGWRQTLQAMDAVHHQITNHVVSLDGDEATCRANMQGTHVLANASGGPIWTVGGRHLYHPESAQLHGQQAQQSVKGQAGDFLIVDGDLVAAPTQPLLLAFVEVQDPDGEPAALLVDPVLRGQAGVEDFAHLVLAGVVLILIVVVIPPATAPAGSWCPP